MNPVINPNPEWLFAEPAARARRRAVVLRTACWAFVVILLIAVVLALRGSPPAILIAFVATFAAAATGVEAYWAAEIARRAEARAARTPSAGSAAGNGRRDELHPPEGQPRAALADGGRAAKLAAP